MLNEQIKKYTKEDPYLRHLKGLMELNVSRQIQNQDKKAVMLTALVGIKLLNQYRTFYFAQKNKNEGIKIIEMDRQETYDHLNAVKQSLKYLKDNGKKGFKTEE